ncbi:MAG: transglutaminase-like domain-containing protein [Thermomicrobiales bacterium]
MTGGDMAVAIDELAAGIAGPDGDVVTRARRLTDWLHGSLEWVATDYQQRSVDEILERGAGNCAEQAKVLDALLRASGIQTRWIAEINVHPASEQRQADSEGLKEQFGLGAAVFDYRHNDHRWLEIRDDEAGEWLPADATLAVVGVAGWIEARLGFEPRPPDAEEMLVPFCIVVRDLDRVLHENRTGHYLIDLFNQHYGGGLEGLAAWGSWTEQALELGELGARTFRNEYDLHGEIQRIERFLETYRELAEQARSAGIKRVKIVSN